jgi:secreted trypsin-like serine protease
VARAGSWQRVPVTQAPPLSTLMEFSNVSKGITEMNRDQQAQRHRVATCNVAERYDSHAYMESSLLSLATNSHLIPHEQARGS